jgi:CheY-like chemotaxis protein
VQSDRELLSRVVANLVSNAIKYSDPAKGDKKRILLSATLLPSCSRIDVVDNGIGIAELQWSDIFRPFVQLHNPERDREKGVGLGLSIVSAIMPLLSEHRIAMSSKIGRGTRFSIEVPLAAGPVYENMRSSYVDPEDCQDISGLYVVYIEDDKLVRQSTLAVFDSRGVLHESVGSLMELKQKLPKMERTPDIIVSDYRLPGNSTAVDAVQAILKEFDLDIPSIILTGEVGTLDLQGIRTVVLEKPVSPGRLLREIALLTRS